MFGVPVHLRVRVYVHLRVHERVYEHVHVHVHLGADEPPFFVASIRIVGAARGFVTGLQIDDIALCIGCATWRLLRIHPLRSAAH
jgi:hypothetical protein